MAEDIATLGIEVRTNGVQQAARELQLLEERGGRAEVATSGLSKSVAGLKTAFAGLGVAAAIKQFVGAADEMANIESRIRLVTKSSAELAKVQGELFRRSQETQTSFRANADLYVSMARATDGLGLSQSRLLGLTDGISKAFVVSGAGAAETSTAIRQLGQALQSGTLRGDEFNSMAENAPRLMKAIADGIGVTRGELRQWAEDGKLTTDVVLPALEKGLRSVDGEFSQMPATVSRATAALGNAFDKWASDTNQQFGLNASLANSITAIADNFGLIADSAAVAGAAVVGKYVGSIVTATQATIASSAAAVRAAEAEAALLIVRKEHVAMLLAEAQAAAAAATGMQRLAIVEAQILPLQGQLAAATGAAAAAQTALIPGATLARGALAALGGPIGLVTTALTVGATAWMLWGDNADKAAAKTEDAVTKRIDGMIQKLDLLNAGLERATRKAFAQTVAAGESELKTVGAEIQYLKTQLDALDDKGGRGRFTDEGKDMQAKLSGFVARQIELESQLGAARQNSAKVGTEALDQYITKFATAEQKLAKSREEIVAGYMAVIKQTSTDGAFDAKNASHVAALKQLGVALQDVDKKSQSNTKSTSDAARAAEEATREYDQLIGSIRNKVAAEQASATYGEQMTDGQKLAVQLMSQLRDGTLKLTDARKAGLAAALQELIVIEKANDAKDEQTKRDKERAKLEADYAANINAALGPLEERARASELELQNYGKTEAQIQRTTISRIEEAKAILEQRLALTDLTDAQRASTEAAISYYSREIEARKKIAESSGLVDAMNQQVAMWRSIDQTAHDTFVSIFDSGKDVFERLRDTLKNTLYDLLYQMTVRKWIIDISASMSGQGVSQQAFGAGGGGSWLNNASNAYSLYNSGALTGGIGSIPGANMAGTAYANYTGTGIDGLLATNGAYGTAGSGAVSGLGAGMGMFGGAMLGYQLSGGNPAGTFAGGAIGVAGYGAAAGAAAGTGAVAGASAALAAIPVWGWIALAAMAILAGNQGGGTPHLGAATLTNFDDSQRTLKHEEAIGDETVWGGFKGNEGLAGPLNSLGIGIAKTIEGTLANFGDNRQVSVFSAFGADDDDASRGILRVFGEDGGVLAQNTSEGNMHRGVKFADDPEEGFAEFTESSGQVIRDALVAADLPGWVDDILGTLGDAPGLALVNQTIATINAIQDASERLEPILGITAEGLAGIVENAGGLDAALQAVNAYASLSLSSAEKWQISQQDLVRAFGDLNVSVPQSTDAFESMLRGIDQTTDSGQELYTNLLLLAPAFYSVANAVEDAFDSISKSTAKAVNDFAYDVMTDEQRYAFLDESLDKKLQEIQAATDPAEISKLVDEWLAMQNQAWGLLSDDEKRRLLPEFQNDAMEVESVGQGRLSVAPIDSAESDAKEIEREDRQAAKTKTAVKEGISEGMMQAATMMAQAGVDQATAAALIKAAADSLRGAFAGYETGRG